jgi:hypothetical protein
MRGLRVCGDQFVHVVESESEKCMSDKKRNEREDSERTLRQNRRIARES